jgi:hypothetical protein
MCFSPDGRSLLAHAYDNTLQLWDLGTGKPIRQMGENQPDGGFGTRLLVEGISQFRQFGRNSVAYSPDGKAVAFACPDATVRIVEAGSGLERCRFAAHQAEITALAFMPDGRALITGSCDSTVLVWQTGGLAAGAKELSAAELKAAWADLAGTDASKAYRSIRTLTAVPDQAVPLAQEHLRPMPALDPQRIPQLLKDLDSDQYPVRKQAAEELEKLGDVAREPVRKALGEKPSLDVSKRLEEILLRIETQGLTQEQLRDLRILEMLEHTGTPAARDVLKRLAGGSPGARLTVEAKAALARLEKVTR